MMSSWGCQCPCRRSKASARGQNQSIPIPEPRAICQINRHTFQCREPRDGNRQLSVREAKDENAGEDEAETRVESRGSRDEVPRYRICMCIWLSNWELSIEGSPTIARLICGNACQQSETTNNGQGDWQPDTPSQPIPQIHCEKLTRHLQMKI